MQFRGTLITHSNQSSKVAPPLSGEQANVRFAFSDYMMLLKPRIISLLLVTTLIPMYLAAENPPGGWLVFWTLLGGTLAAGGANTINQYADRDIDHVMVRTRRIRC
jgi:protoheme IX farnesyltransferase